MKHNLQMSSSMFAIASAMIGQRRNDARERVTPSCKYALIVY